MSNYRTAEANRSHQPDNTRTVKPLEELPVLDLSKIKNAYKVSSPATDASGYRPLPSGPILVSDGRGMRSVAGYRPQADFKGYTGPFVEPTQTVDEPAESRAPYNIFMLPGKESSAPAVRKGEDNWFSRVLRPYEDELEAERNGLRWHWALEHRFMPPGSQWNDTVWKGVDRENAWLAQMLKQRAAEQPDNTMMSPVAKERMRSTMANQWKQFLSDVQKGHFDAYGGTSDTANQWADSFKQRYESIFGEGSSADLAPVAEVLGKRTELARKNMQDLMRDISATEFVVDNLDTWLKDGSFADPKRAQQLSTVLDKIAQRLSSSLGGDSASMADAEKKRIQIVYLPEEAKQQVYQTIKDYREQLRQLMLVSGSEEWRQNNWGKIKEMDNELTSDNGTLEGLAAALGGFLTKQLDAKDLPQDLMVNFQAAKEAYDSYMEGMMFAANVAPNVIYDFAKYLHDQQLKLYNTNAATYGRAGDALTSVLPQLDLSKLERAVPPSELLTALTFVPPAYHVKPQGGDVSSNPASKGEQKPVQTGAISKTKVRGF